MLPLTGAGSQGFRCGDKSPRGSWVQYKLGKESSRTRTMYRILGSQHKLALLSSHAVGGESSVPHSVSLSFPGGDSRDVQTLSAPTRPHGVSDFCRTFGTPMDEGFSALGRGVAPVLTPSPQPQSENNTSWCAGAPPVGGPDGSLSGWGATMLGRTVNGTWDQRLAQAHINLLELWAVFFALKHFLQFLQGRHVLVKTDNTTVVAYINRQGGTRSLQLHRLARKIIMWSSSRLMSLRATHVPGVLNRGADLLSRGNPLYGEWTLHPQVVEQVWQKYGRAAVDLFASQENAHCRLFFSLSDVNAPLGVDALAHSWPNVLLYAFPPLSLISPTLARVREQGLSLILIAPRWSSKHWVAEIIQLLVGEPWPLPIRRDLLSQARGEIYHPHPDRMALWAWPVKGGT
ncbi:uncharacterized protein LOC141752970 [Sebastes fasciatus]|uniref:uncharacterized protein LOC141752970 n=1 Tax=Sebastes fasciatus TaxID=394691 RepID=UPI003D9F9975